MRAVFVIVLEDGDTRWVEVDVSCLRDIDVYSISDDDAEKIVSITRCKVYD